MSFLHTDIPELGGFDSGLVLTELSRLAKHHVQLTEQLLCQLWELAGAILHDSGGDPDVVDSILLSLQDGGEDNAPVPSGKPGERGDIYRAVLPENKPLIDKLRGTAGLYARLVLYRFLNEQTGETAVIPPVEVDTAVQNRISYMKSAPSDKAYLKFSEVLPDCRFSEVHSFVDACEEVYNGLCRFCLFPLEVFGEGRLTGFSRLTVKYGLTVAAVCDIESQTHKGRRVTRYGLLCRGTGDSHLRQVLSSVPVRYVELLHTTTVSPSLTDLLNAAAFCGLTPIRADTLSAVTPETGTYAGYPEDAPDEADAPYPLPPVSLVFDMPATADPATFARFLSVEASDDVFMGAYGVV